MLKGHQPEASFRLIRFLAQNPATQREDFFKIQQEREDFFKIQQDRERTSSKSSKTQKGARVADNSLSTTLGSVT